MERLVGFHILASGLERVRTGCEVALLVSLMHSRHSRAHLAFCNKSGILDAKRFENVLLEVVA